MQRAVACCCHCRSILVLGRCESESKHGMARVSLSAQQERSPSRTRGKDAETDAGGNSDLASCSSAGAMALIEASVSPLPRHCKWYGSPVAFPTPWPTPTCTQTLAVSRAPVYPASPAADLPAGGKRWESRDKDRAARGHDRGDCAATARTRCCLLYITRILDACPSRGHVVGTVRCKVSGPHPLVPVK